MRANLMTSHVTVLLSAVFVRRPQKYDTSQTPTHTRREGLFDVPANFGATTVIFALAALVVVPRQYHEDGPLDSGLVVGGGRPGGHQAQDYSWQNGGPQKTKKENHVALVELSGYGRDALQHCAGCD